MENQTPKSENITCKNCDTKFSGNYCPQCGQSVKDYNQPFGFMLYDLMGNIFAFDTRLWRTLVAVLFMPGKLASEFIKGHRVRYMPPFRFYVFISFVFFLMLNYSTLSGIQDDDDAGEITTTGEAVVDSIKNELAVVADSMLKDTTMTIKEYKAFEKTRGFAVSEDDTELEIKIKEAIKHPEYYFPQFIKYLSWFLFLLMPLYGGMLWLFFRKKHKYYLGHLIFAINQHSFLFVTMILIMGINMIFPNKSSSPESWLVYLIPIYSIIGAKKLYQRKWSTVFFKLCAIFFMYSFLLVIALVSALVVTFA